MWLQMHNKVIYEFPTNNVGWTQKTLAFYFGGMQLGIEID